MKTITLKPASGITMHLKLSAFFATLCCIFFSFSSLAQPPKDCGSINCTANDVQIVKAYFSDKEGKAISCDGGPVDGYLHVVLSTNTPRNGVSVSGNLIIDDVSTPIGACFGNNLNGSNNDFTFPNPFKITCESTISLGRLPGMEHRLCRIISQVSAIGRLHILAEIYHHCAATVQTYFLILKPPFTNGWPPETIRA